MITPDEKLSKLVSVPEKFSKVYFDGLGFLEREYERANDQDIRQEISRVYRMFFRGLLEELQSSTEKSVVRSANENNCIQEFHNLQRFVRRNAFVESTESKGVHE